MLKWKYTCIALLICFALHTQAQESYTAHVQQYIKQYKSLAIAEQKRSGIPAAVTLGQGILETQAGTSELVTGANNHFGIKCKKEWTGETFAHTDDAPNECFRKYPKASDSYKDHSDYLKGSARYASLFKLSQTDYAGWAVGLKKCGYATNPRYAQQLIKIIEDFKLQDYTYAGMDNDDEYKPDGTASSKPGTRASAILDEDDPVLVKAKLQTASSPAAAAAIAAAPAAAPVAVKPPAAKPVTNTTALKENTPPKQPERIVKTQEPPATNEAAEANQIQATNKTLDNTKPVTVNGLKAVYAFKGELPFQYAMKFNLRYEHLLDMNDLPDAPLAANMFIYLEKKSAKGQRPYHIVKPGETIAQISQLEGVQLRRVMAMNRIENGEEPVPGTQLYLQDNAPAKPQVVAFAATGALQNNKRLTEPTASNSTYIDKSTISQGNPAFNNDAVVEKHANTPRNRNTVITPAEPKKLADVPVPKPAAVTAETTATEVKPIAAVGKLKERNPATKPALQPMTAAPVATTPAEVSKPIEKPVAIAEAPKPAAKPATPPAAVTKPLLTPIGTPAPVKPKPVAVAAAPVNKPVPQPVTSETKKTETPAALEEDDRRVAETGSDLLPEPEETAPKAKRAKPVPAAQPVETKPVAVEKPVETKPVAIEKPAEEKPLAIEKPAEEKPLAIEKPIEEKPAVIEKPVATVEQPEEPMDDLARLKAKLDRVVYVNDKKVAAANRSTSSGTTVARNTGGNKYYTVRDGDTAFSIAKDNNISMKQLLDWNNLDFDQIKTGQKLRVKE